MKNKLLALLYLFPLLQAGKPVEDWLKVEENQLYSHLLQAGKEFLPSSLPDGMTESSVDTLVASYSNKAADIGKAKFENGLLSFQAAAPPAAPAKPADTTALQAALDQQKKVTDDLMKMQCSTVLQTLTASLPVPVRDSIRKKYANKIFTAVELQASIDEAKDLIAPFMTPQVNNRGMDVHAGVDQYDKLQAAADLFFLSSSQGLNPLKAGTPEYKAIADKGSGIRSIRELYVLCTGDENITGKQDRSMRLTASLETSDFANITLDAMNKRLVRDYIAIGLDAYKAIVTMRDGVKDFKSQKFVRFGGYANLPVVAESGPYLGLTSPSDEKGSWTPTKKGGTEDLTRELIMNDDVSAVQKIPTRMARAAAQTLHQFVFDFIRPGVNPTIFDNIALYHSTHANTGTSALDTTSLAAARLRMKKQAMLSNSVRLGIRAKYLIVPSDLESTADGLTFQAYGQNNATPTFLQRQGLVVVPIDYWTDATDWVLASTPQDVEMIELGFVNGQETPEVFVSDLPNAGSFFTNDVITYKIRHEYGGAIVDWRGLDGSIVAG